MPLQPSSPLPTAPLERAEPVQPPPSTTPRSFDWWYGALIAVMIGALIWTHWTRLPGMWGDSTRWLFEGSRVAAGELPYRDFTWQYPPLSILIIGAVFELFGATFVTAQLAVIVLSLLVVLLTWAVARTLMPSSLALAATAVLVAGGGQIGSLFSLEVYSPALLTGFIGLLLVLLGGMRAATTGTHAAACAFLIAGSLIALLSKVEFALAAGVVVAVSALLDDRWRTARGDRRAWAAVWIPLVLACLLPALAAYGLLARVVGARELLTALGGYGMAGEACPYWPTGIGVVSMIGALGFGVLLAAFLTLVRGDALARQLGGKYLLLWIVAATGFIVYLVHLAFLLDTLAATDLGFGSALHQPPPLAWRAISMMVTFGGPGLAIQYWAVVLLPVAVLMWWRRSPGASPGLVLLLAAASALAFRSLFGTTLWDVPSLEKATYPVLAVLGAAFAWRVVAWTLDHTGTDRGAGPRRRAWTAHGIAAAALMAWAMIMFAGRIARDVVSHDYRPLHTEAGTVRLLAWVEADSAYRFVMANTTPDDIVIDVPYGGGINFASRRRSSLYSTQQKMLLPPAWVRERDLRQASAHPPEVVIAERAPDLGAVYGLGRWAACPMPDLVWRPARATAVAQPTFPVVEYLRREYVEVGGPDRRALMVPRSAEASAQAGRSHGWLLRVGLTQP